MSPFTNRHQKHLALALATIAGYVDGYGLLALSTFLSFMSGNTTQTGANLGRADYALALPSAVAIAAFLVGVFLGNLRPKRANRFAAAELAAVGLSLVAASLGLHFNILTAIPAIGLISLSMGVMNTTLSRVGNEAVNLTFVTGALNKIGSHLAMAARHEPLEDPAGPRDTHLARALFLTAIWTAFLIGAIIAGFATARLGAWTLMPAAGLLLLVSSAGSMSTKVQS